MSVPRSFTTVDLFALTVAATSVEIALAVTIDIAPILIVAGLAASLVRGAPGLALAVALLSSAVVAAVTLAVLARRGTSLGSLVMGLRAVDHATASPAGRDLVAAALRGHLRALSLRRGRDPLAAALAPFEFTEQALAAARGLTPAGMATRPALAMFDSGQQVLLQGSLVIGRGPFAGDGGEVPTFEWADLSRTLSKTHLRIDWDGHTAWATDLGSTNGSALEVNGELRRLRPGDKVPLPAIARLALGDRQLRVEAPR